MTLLNAHCETAFEALLFRRNELVATLDRRRTGRDALSKPMRLWLVKELLQVVSAADAFAGLLGKSDDVAMSGWQDEEARRWIAKLPDMVIPELKVVKNKPSGEVALDETAKGD